MTRGTVPAQEDMSVPVSLHQTKWVARVFGLFGPITLPLAGLPVALLLALPAIGLRRPSRTFPLARAIGWFLILGAATCVLVALVNGVAPSTMPAQLAAVGILVFAYRATTVNIESAAILTGWLAAASTLLTIAFGNEMTRTSFAMLWKFGIAYTVTTFVLYLAARYTTPLISVIGLLAIGAWGTTLNYRSFGLVCAVAAALSIAKLGRKARPLVSITIAGVALIAIASLLPDALSNGTFGADVQSKALSQADDGPSILGGRTEPPLSIAAISAKGILWGWGNVQAIDTDTVTRAIGIANHLGMTDTDNFLRIWIREDGLISLHSMLTVPWAEGGLLAAVGMLLAIVLFLWGACVARGKWSVLVTLVCVQNVWDVLFSPWTGARVVSVAAAIVLAGFAIREAQDRKLAITAPPGVNPLPRLRGA